MNWWDYEGTENESKFSDDCLAKAVQIEYNNWFRKNANKFQLYIDNTNSNIEEIARQVVDFVNTLN